MIDYDEGWAHWRDMIKYSPAPFHRRRLILKLANQICFKSVLDIGCGNGELLAALGRRRPGARVVGADISQRIISLNRANLPKFDFHQLDICSGYLSEQFDLVVCSEVLEHVPDWQKALWHLRRMCRRYLVLTVPSGKVFPIDRLMGHHRHFSPDELSEGLQRVGFEPERMWCWGFPFHTLYKHVINFSPESSVKRFSTGAYTATDRALACLLTGLFYLNLFRLGSQLIVRAHAVRLRL